MAHNMSQAKNGCGWRRNIFSLTDVLTWKKSKGFIKLFLCSIYHPHGIAEQKEFYDELDQFITNQTRNSEILMGADINCNVGITLKRFSNILRPQGINNRNIKGRELLYLYKTNNLKILLSYFKHINYITYRSFNDKKSAHMLDNFLCCDQLFKRISDCKVTKFGVRIDHTAIITKFRLTSIKFNNEQQQSSVIDWKELELMMKQDQYSTTRI